MRKYIKLNQTGTKDFVLVKILYKLLLILILCTKQSRLYLNVEMNIHFLNLMQ